MSEAAVTVPGRAGPPEVAAQSSRRWWILGVVGLAQLMVVLDATIVNIALPSAQRALAFSNADRQWVVTAYSLAFGGLLLLGGRLSDLVGRRRMLIIGLIGFASASAFGGAATGFAMLVIGRGAQGAFGAMLAPAALSTLTTTFTDPAERGKAFGVYGAIAGAGGAVGLLLGGLLTEYLSWRWCLYVNVILAVVAVAGAVRLLERHPRDPAVHIDWPGTALVVAGLVAVVYGLSEAETEGWGAPITDVLLPAGVLLLAAFALVERRVQHPLLPPRIVASRFRGGAYLAIGLSSIGIFGIFLFLTYYLQLTLGYSPVTTGLAFLPMVAAIMVASTTSSGVLMPRLGPRPLVPVGLLAAAGGMVVLATQLALHTSYPAQILPALLLTGSRHGPGVRLRDEHRDLWRCPGGRGRGLGHGQHQPAGRRLHRHRAAEHHRRQRPDQLPGGPRARPAGPGRSAGAQLRRGILGVGRDPGRLRDRVRAGAGPRHPGAGRPSGGCQPSGGARRPGGGACRVTREEMIARD